SSPPQPRALDAQRDDCSAGPESIYESCTEILSKTERSVLLRIFGRTHPSLPSKAGGRYGGGIQQGAGPTAVDRALARLLQLARLLSNGCGCRDSAAAYPALR